MRSKSKVDLHLHTTASDGTFSPSEVVSFAKDIGLDIISITDHDTVSGVAEAMKTGETAGIEVIPGIEMGSDVDGFDIHILGYFIDHTDKPFVKYLKDLQALRMSRANEIISRLQKHKLDITMEDVIKQTRGGVLTRAHIGKAMVSKGLVHTVNEAFDRYLGRDKDCYVQKYNYSSHDVITAIKGSGGVPVIAHPGISKIDDHIYELIKIGIMGIEVYCRDHTKEQIARYLEIANENGLIVTGGSDDHGPRTPGRFVIGQIPVPLEVVTALKRAAKRS
jgi:3',5'-nucleoside bisphosphate phosphatase